MLKQKSIKNSRSTKNRKSLKKYRKKTYNKKKYGKKQKKVSRKAIRKKKKLKINKKVGGFDFKKPIIGLALCALLASSAPVAAAATAGSAIALAVSGGAPYSPVGEMDQPAAADSFVNDGLEIFTVMEDGSLLDKKTSRKLSFTSSELTPYKNKEIVLTKEESLDPSGIKGIKESIIESLTSDDEAEDKVVYASDKAHKQFYQKNNEKFNKTKGWSKFIEKYLLDNNIFLVKKLGEGIAKTAILAEIDGQRKVVKIFKTSGDCVHYSNSKSSIDKSTTKCKDLITQEEVHKFEDGNIILLQDYVDKHPLLEKLKSNLKLEKAESSSFSTHLQASVEQRQEYIQNEIDIINFKINIRSRLLERNIEIRHRDLHLGNVGKEREQDTILDLDGFETNNLISHAGTYSTQKSFEVNLKGHPLSEEDLREYWELLRLPDNMNDKRLLAFLLYYHDDPQFKIEDIDFDKQTVMSVFGKSYDPQKQHLYRKTKEEITNWKNNNVPEETRLRSDNNKKLSEVLFDDEDWSLDSGYDGIMIVPEKYPKWIEKDSFNYFATFFKNDIYIQATNRCKIWVKKWFLHHFVDGVDGTIRTIRDSSLIKIWLDDDSKPDISYLEYKDGNPDIVD